MQNTESMHCQTTEEPSPCIKTPVSSSWLLVPHGSISSLRRDDYRQSAFSFGSGIVPSWYLLYLLLYLLLLLLLLLLLFSLLLASFSCFFVFVLILLLVVLSLFVLLVMWLSCHCCSWCFVFSLMPVRNAFPCGKVRHHNEELKAAVGSLDRDKVRQTWQGQRGRASPAIWRTRLHGCNHRPWWGHGF